METINENAAQNAYELAKGAFAEIQKKMMNGTMTPADAIQAAKVLRLINAYEADSKAEQARKKQKDLAEKIKTALQGLDIPAGVVIIFADGEPSVRFAQARNAYTKRAGEKVYTTFYAGKGFGSKAELCAHLGLHVGADSATRVLQKNGYVAPDGVNWSK